MLALTKKTDYALIALAQLARRQGRLISAREVAEGTGVPLPILTNILKTLTQAGMVGSERGSRGGYFLARAAESISLDDLITAVEGPIHFVKCLSGESANGQNGGTAFTGACLLEPKCPIRIPAQRVHEKFKQFLKNVSLAELGVDGGPAAAPCAVNIESGSTRTDVYTELTT